MVNFQQKSDYENPPMEMFNQNYPVVAQPMAHSIMPRTQPMTNIGNQIVPTLVGQMPSQSKTIDSTTGQVSAPTTPLGESEVKPLQPINKPQNDPSQTDIGDGHAMNDPQQPESQQNVEH